MYRRSRPHYLSPEHIVALVATGAGTEAVTRVANIAPWAVRAVVQDRRRSRIPPAPEPVQQRLLVHAARPATPTGLPITDR